MYNTLIKLLIGASLIQFGLSFKDFEECSSKKCLSNLQSASIEAAKIKWKAISVFPEEAKKFR